MLSWLRQTCRPIFSPISTQIYQILILSSSAVQLYLRIYYPLVFLEELARTHLEDGANLYGTALALLTIAAAIYRSLELFFPKIRILSVQDQQDPQFKDAEVYESEAIAMDLEGLDSIDLVFGLTNAEVSDRLSKYGRNVLWAGRNWRWTIMRSMLTIGDVVPEVCRYRSATSGNSLNCLGGDADCSLLRRVDDRVRSDPTTHPFQRY